MGNRGDRHDRGPHRRTTRRPTVRPARSVQHDDGPEQPLMAALRGALRSGEPVDLLTAVSSLVEIADPRRRGPFDTGPVSPTLADLVQSFIEVSYAETTAALLVIRALTSDESLSARIGEELEKRRHPMPDWLTGLHDSVAAPDVWFLTHVQGDGDDYLLGVRTPSGHEMSVLVYVDHQLGTVVKDAFMTPASLEDLAIKVGTTIDTAEQSLTRTDPQQARAVIEAAIDFGDRIHPPLETETWPLCRPIVEWMLRMLPAGGMAPGRKEWTEAELAEIAEDFFTSKAGAGVDHADERGLLDSVLWFGSTYSTGDPLQWSPVTVELLLADWFPRKVVAPVDYLAKLPDLVRWFIQYCHDREGIPPHLTRETLAAVDVWEPEYQRAIRTDRLQGPVALAARLLEDSWGEDLDPLDDPFDDLSVGELMTERLERAVGGRVRLANLDVDALPDEPFVWAGIPDDVRDAVAETLDHCDRCADELLDVEHRTAMRRFLSRAAVGDPAVFRRRASRARGAAAVAWVICKANDSFGVYGRGLEVQELMAWFGVKGGSVSQRAEPLLRANGIDPFRLFGSMDLGAPDLLVSRRRAKIVAERDRWAGQ